MVLKLVLVRHGLSEWNKENKFTGWTDVDLAKEGIKEAVRAGKVLKKNGFSFDIAYTSYLKRAIKTLFYILDELNQLWIPVVKDWHLNERHYGALQGLNKKETAKKYGDEQVHLWRRSYSLRPLLLRRNPKVEPYKSLGIKVPKGESLKDTIERVVPYWRKEIFPKLKKGKKIIISAHGNSLRALIKHLENISDKDIINVEIPVGNPLVYEFDSNFKVRKRYYLEK